MSLSPMLDGALPAFLFLFLARKSWEFKETQLFSPCICKNTFESYQPLMARAIVLCSKRLHVFYSRSAFFYLHVDEDVGTTEHWG